MAQLPCDFPRCPLTDRKVENTQQDQVRSLSLPAMGPPEARCQTLGGVVVWRFVVRGVALCRCFVCTAEIIVHAPCQTAFCRQTEAEA